MIERIGNCQITDEIGSGGMAVVYKGIQESLNRTVAIKALKTSVSNDNDIVARFEREATSIASFQHENIITVYDFLRERGALFIIMEFVEGIDLYDLLDRCGRQGRPGTRTEFCKLLYSLSYWNDLGFDFSRTLLEGDPLNSRREIKPSKSQPHSSVIYVQ